MVVENMVLPIEVMIKDSKKEYKMKFDGYTFLKRCCGCKSIDCTIYSRKIYKRIEGFNKKKKGYGFEYLERVLICPNCGEISGNIYILKSESDLVRKAFLKARRKND